MTLVNSFYNKVFSASFAYYPSYTGLGLRFRVEVHVDDLNKGVVSKSHGARDVPL